MSAPNDQDAPYRHGTVDVDWPHCSAKAAAKALGVRQALIEGLAQSKGIRGVKSTGRTGAPVWRISTEDIAALRKKMTEQ